MDVMHISNIMCPIWKLRCREILFYLRHQLIGYVFEWEGSKEELFAQFVCCGGGAQWRRFADLSAHRQIAPGRSAHGITHGTN